MSDCLFCKIIEGSIPSTKIYEDEQLFAFKDINPMAPVHVVIVPKVHFDSLNEVDENTSAVLGHLMSKVPEIAQSLGVKESGYRLVNNCGVDGGQTVGHIHYHLLGGRNLQWPPG
jgi:histidine triad (HIT) family protein